MVEVRWRNGFAVGLTAGICSILIINIWGGAIYEIATCVSQGACQGSPAQNDSGDEPEWWRWIRRLVSAEDSLAQWSMALLSLAAVVLLWLTLRASRDTLSATQKMAVDAREIGEAQVRAYLTIEDAAVTPSFRQNGALVDWHVEVSIRNTGHSPARNLYISVKNVTGEPSATSLCPNLASGAEERAFVFLTFAAQDLQFHSDLEDQVLIVLDVTVSFKDVFCTGDETRTEATKFVGYAKLLQAETSKLADVSGMVGLFPE
ncbi:hypothetical protein [Citreimonas sp.]|uniref:hypothetical protein n=1 Tax=Citreimonas sp. TaxID=3036715 RepID=UPI0035C81718